MTQPSALTGPQINFIEKHLKVYLTPIPVPADAPKLARDDGAAALFERWTKAKQSADARLDALRQRLRADGNPEVVRLAESDLFSLGLGENRALLSCLIEYRGAAPDKKPAAADRLRRAAQAYAALIAASPLADAIDANPYGVSVDLKGSLGRALTDLADALR